MATKWLLMKNLSIAATAAFTVKWQVWLYGEGDVDKILK